MNDVKDLKCPGCGEVVRVVKRRIEKHFIPADVEIEVPWTTWGGDRQPTYRIIVTKRCEFSRAHVDVMGPAR